VTYEGAKNKSHPAMCRRSAVRTELNRAARSQASKTNQAM